MQERWKHDPVEVVVGNVKSSHKGKRIYFQRVKITYLDRGGKLKTSVLGGATNFYLIKDLETKIIKLEVQKGSRKAWTKFVESTGRAVK